MANQERTFYSHIDAEMAEKYDLESSFNFPYSTVLLRIRRRLYKGNRHKFPFQETKDKVVLIVLTTIKVS